MDDLLIRYGAGLSMDAIAGLLNEAFVEYPVPITLAADDVASMVERDDISLDASPVAYLDEALVGLALVALRSGGARARLAAMGVVPWKRGRGIARALLRQAVEEARARAARSIVLEVFESNEPARRLYQSHGFLSTRRLLGFTLTRDALRSTFGARVSLRALPTLDLLAIASSCLAREDPLATPPWQLDIPALARFSAPTALYGIVAEAEAQCVGYLVLGRERPSAQLIHLGILPRWRRQGMATAALDALFDLHADLDEIHLPPLVPAGSSLVPFLTARGARLEALAQLEMMLWFETPSP